MRSRLLQIKRRSFIAGMTATPFLAPLSGVNAGIQSEPRIAAIDTVAVDLLGSMNLIPIAVCSARNYRMGLSDVVLPANVTDIGFTAEPNLELLSILKPDLIVSGWPMNAAATMEQIAPTISLNLYSGQLDAYEALQRGLLSIARPLERTQAAISAIAKADTTIATAAQRLRTLGALPKLYVVDLRFGSGKVGVYGTHSLPHAILTRLGLCNAWQEKDDPWGWKTVGLERLADDSEATVICLRSYGAAERPIERRLTATNLWRGLPAVKANRIIWLPPTDLFGGLQTAERFATLLTDALSQQMRQ